MKRFHLHLSVPDLAQSIRFYSSLFGTEPAVRKPDYAKWMLDDPRVNFAISSRGSGANGLNHLGLQVESAAELEDVRRQFAAADAAHMVDEPGARCCYARSDKHWVRDPQGIAWEAFHTLDAIPMFSGAAALDAGTAEAKPKPTRSSCCTPAARSAEATAGCCR